MKTTATRADFAFLLDPERAPAVVEAQLIHLPCYGQVGHTPSLTDPAESRFQCRNWACGQSWYHKELQLMSGQEIEAWLAQFQVLVGVPEEQVHKLEEVEVEKVRFHRVRTISFTEKEERALKLYGFRRLKAPRWPFR